MHATEQERMEALQELRRLGVADEAPGVCLQKKLANPFKMLSPWFFLFTWIQTGVSFCAELEC